MRRLAAALLALGLAACAGRSPARESTSDPDLQRLAGRIVAAVRAKDVDPLLAIASHRFAETLSAGDVQYCLLFDSTCIPPEFLQRRSVQALLTGAKKLRVRARVFHHEPSTGARYGVIEIFDAATVNEARLQSHKYFCQQWVREIATWTFVDRGSGWQPITPIFDYGTDFHCPPVVER